MFPQLSAVGKDGATLAIPKSDRALFNERESTLNAMYTAKTGRLGRHFL